MAATHGTPTGDLNAHGITPSGDVYWNQTAEALIELAVERGEGRFSAHRALVTETGERTGRSPNDKYIVDESTCLLYTSPSPRDRQKSRMPSSA